MEKDLIFLFKSFLFSKMRNIQGHQFCHNTFGGSLFPLQNSKIWMSHSQHFRWFVCSSTTSVPRGLEKAFSKEARKHVCKLFGILETNWFFTNWMSRILNWLFFGKGNWAIFQHCKHLFISAYHIDCDHPFYLLASVTLVRKKDLKLLVSPSEYFYVLCCWIY